MAAAGLLAAAVVAGCRGAGMNTHTFVGHRAATRFGLVSGEPRAELYNAAIAAHLDAVHGGADFPDWGYACGHNHSAGEAAHWPPWQAAAVTYLRSRPDFASGNWSEDTSRLVAFVFGVSVHYISDELWEGLNPEIGRGQGFVRTLSSFNLGHPGTTDDDEGTANLAADFGVAWELNESGIAPWKRVWPIDEIVAIYGVSGNHNVNRTSVVACKALFDLALWAETTFGPLLFPVYTERAKHVPMVAERLVDLPVGGVDDMAVWAAWVWQRVARWLDNGAPAVPPPNADADKDTDNGGSDDSDSAWARRFIAHLRANPTDQACARGLAAAGPPDAHFAPAGGADESALVQGRLAFNGPPQHASCAQRLLDAFWSSVAPKRPRLPKLTTAAVTARATAVRERGHENTAADADTTTAAAAHVRAPVASWTDGTPGGYSGRAVATGDWDGDGRTDIAFSSYGVGEPGRPQVGAVTVVYGALGVAPQRLAGPLSHGRFGWALATVDVNLDGVDDLAVSAPTSSWEDTPSRRHATNTTPFVANFGAVYVFAGTNRSSSTRGANDRSSSTRGANDRSSSTRGANDRSSSTHGANDRSSSSRGANDGARGGSGQGGAPALGAAPLAQLCLNITTQDSLTGLGDALAVGDLDGDGAGDLIVGAAMSSFRPNASVPDTESIRRGALFGFLSRAVSATTAVTTADVTTTNPGGAAASDRTAAGGAGLAGGVGNTGGLADAPSVTRSLDARRDADLVLEGPDGYGWFGQSAAVASGLLFVGSPGFRGPNGTAGRLYALRLPSPGAWPRNATVRSLDVAATVTSADPLSEFGHAVAVVPAGGRNGGRNSDGSSSNGGNAGGAGTSSSSAAAKKGSGGSTGTSPRTRNGHTDKNDGGNSNGGKPGGSSNTNANGGNGGTSDTDKYDGAFGAVAVSAPAANAAATRSGKVHVLPLGTATFPRSGPAASWTVATVPTLCVVRPPGRLGRAGYVLTAASGQLVVSAPLANPSGAFAARETGRVDAWSVEALTASEPSPGGDGAGGCTAAPAWSLAGAAPRGRFGAGVAVLNATHVAVGAPFAGPEGAGIVGVFAVGSGAA